MVSVVSGSGQRGSDSGEGGSTSATRSVGLFGRAHGTAFRTVPRSAWPPGADVAASPVGIEIGVERHDAYVSVSVATTSSVATIPSDATVFHEDEDAEGDEGAMSAEGDAMASDGVADRGPTEFQTIG